MIRYLANLDFDSRLAGKAGGAQLRPGPPDENSVLWRLIARPGDEILVPGLRKAFDAPAIGPLAGVHYRPPEMEGEDHVVPWGVDVLAQRLCRHLFADSLLEAAKRLNDRRFAFDLDPIAGSFFAEDPREVLPLAARGERLMLKPRHGGFGRGLRRVLGRESDENLIGWVRARCEDGGLIVEPLLQMTREWGAHWDLSMDEDGQTVAKLLGRTSLACDAHGQFTASNSPVDHDVGFVSSSELPDPILESGYVGPLTLDQCEYVRNGERRVGLYRDINARWTVGRLVYEARSRLGCRSLQLQRINANSSRAADAIVIPPIRADAQPRWQCVATT